MFGEEADFDFVTCDVQEGGVRQENLTNDMGGKLVEARTRKVDEGERYREEGDCYRVGVAHTDGKRGAR